MLAQIVHPCAGGKGRSEGYSTRTTTHTHTQAASCALVHDHSTSPYLCPACSVPRPTALAGPCARTIACKAFHKHTPLRPPPQLRDSARWPLFIYGHMVSTQIAIWGAHAVTALLQLRPARNCQMPACWWALCMRVRECNRDGGER